MFRYSSSSVAVLATTYIFFRWMKVISEAAKSPSQTNVSCPPLFFLQTLGDPKEYGTIIFVILTKDAPVKIMRKPSYCSIATFIIIVSNSFFVQKFLKVRDHLSRIYSCKIL